MLGKNRSITHIIEAVLEEIAKQKTQKFQFNSYRLSQNFLIFQQNSETTFFHVKKFQELSFFSRKTVLKVMLICETNFLFKIVSQLNVLNKSS